MVDTDTLPIPDAAFDALRALYDELDAELAETNPRCEFSGRCCDFDAAGHELFSTDLEVAYARRFGGANPKDAPARLCPFWRAGRCELRKGRPFGCRVYFCDPDFAAAMPEVAERYHRKIVALHTRHGVPYRYRRFVASIRESS